MGAGMASARRPSRVTQVRRIASRTLLNVCMLPPVLGSDASTNRGLNRALDTRCPNFSRKSLWSRQRLPRYTPAVDLKALVRAAAAGDEQAWTQLVDRFAGLVWSVARGYSLDQSDAADVSQTTWLRLAESLSSVRDPERLGAWLVTCARRESLRTLRLRTQDLPVSSTYFLEDEAGTPEERVILREDDVELRQAFDRLPSPCQALLRAMFAEPQPSYAALSRAFGMPIGSIGPTRARCLARLKELIVSTRQEGSSNESLDRTGGRRKVS